MRFYMCWIEEDEDSFEWEVTVRKSELVWRKYELEGAVFSGLERQTSAIGDDRRLTAGNWFPESSDRRLSYWGQTSVLSARAQ